MKSIYKSVEGERQIRERYLAFLKYWPVPHQHIRIPTSQGETFVIASGAEDAPPLVLLHGGVANSTTWMGEIRAFAASFRVYCVDVIGEPGLSAPSRPPLSSDAYAVWLDEVLNGLSVQRTALAGISLGGWLVLDFAARRADRVERLAVLCPGGVGRQKLNIVFATFALRMCGEWGRRRLSARILGRGPQNPSPQLKAFLDFIALIHREFRTRMVKLPTFSDQMLQRLRMPVLAIVGGRDVLLDSAGTKRRLERNVPHAEIVFLPESGHVIQGQTATVMEFLNRGREAASPSAQS